MKRYLVDSSAYSRYRSASGPALETLLVEADSLAMNAIIIGELLAGFRHGSRPAANEVELRRFLTAPGFRILEITEQTASVYAGIWAALRSLGRPIPTNDVWIAASAIEHGFTLLTADRHFLGVPGLSLLNTA